MLGATVLWSYSTSSLQSCDFGLAQLAQWVRSHIHPPSKDLMSSSSYQTILPYGTNVQDRLSWPRSYFQFSCLGAMPSLEPYNNLSRLSDHTHSKTARVGYEYRFVMPWLRMTVKAHFTHWMNHTRWLTLLCFRPHFMQKDRSGVNNLVGPSF
jgi:hypothetical protein